MISEKKINKILKNSFEEVLKNTNFDFVNLEDSNFLIRPEDLRSFFLINHYLPNIYDLSRNIRTCESTRIENENSGLKTYPIYNVSRNFTDEREIFESKLEENPYLSFHYCPKSKTTIHKRRKNIREKAQKKGISKKVKVINATYEGARESTVTIREEILEFLTSIHLKKEGYVVGKSIYKPRDEFFDNEFAGIHIPRLHEGVIDLDGTNITSELGVK